MTDPSTSSEFYTIPSYADPLVAIQTETYFGVNSGVIEGTSTFRMSDGRQISTLGLDICTSVDDLDGFRKEFEEAREDFSAIATAMMEWIVSASTMLNDAAGVYQQQVVLTA